MGSLKVCFSRAFHECCTSDQARMARLIYFAGSIRGGRSDAELYARLVQKLTKYGTILTEHVGDCNLSVAGILLWVRFVCIPSLPQVSTSELFLRSFHGLKSSLITVNFIIVVGALGHHSQQTPALLTPN